MVADIGAGADDGAAVALEAHERCRIGNTSALGIDTVTVYAVFSDFGYNTVFCNNVNQLAIYKCVFNNHNNGEFVSWLGKSGYDGPMTEYERTVNSIYGRND